MSADKHRRLALEVAYLRLASRETGLSLNVKWARGITDVLRTMIANGDLVQRRTPVTQRRTITQVYATDAGRAKLASALDRFGPEFGPVSGLSRIEPVRLRKEVRRARTRTPEEARARQMRIANRRTAVHEMIARQQAASA